jgi:general L-amino acid transport system permease protein
MSDMASEASVAFVRNQPVPNAPPPASEVGVQRWLRQNLFSSWINGVFTVLMVAFLVWVIPPIFRFLVTDAVFEGENREACLGENIGACWAFVDAKFGQFMYGLYPEGERWRVNLVGILFIAGLAPMLMPSVGYKRENAIYLLVIFPLVAFTLLTGGNFDLRHVSTSSWGGLLVTLVVATVGITVSLPLGILLALGRRSEMPIIKTFCVVFIEFWRGVPLITVLFMASVMLPLFMPNNTDIDRLARALIGVSLFASAYMAEVVRGGLQAVPKGQYEGAMAMGLGYWQMMRLIVLPQAIKIVIPGIVNTFIGLFKDTSLVIFVGLFDLLGQVNRNFTDMNWASPVTPATGLIFAGFVFWIFCFSMSRYSLFMERRLDTRRR